MQGDEGSRLAAAEKRVIESDLKVIMDTYRLDPDADKDALNKQYMENIQKLYPDEKIEFLTMESDLGEFLNEPDAPQKLAEFNKVMNDYKKMGGVANTLDSNSVDYHKCDLHLAVKCMEVVEEAGFVEVKDYQNLTVWQEIKQAVNYAIAKVNEVVFGGEKAVEMYEAKQDKQDERAAETHNKINIDLGDIIKEAGKGLSEGASGKESDGKSTPKIEQGTGKGGQGRG